MKRSYLTIVEAILGLSGLTSSVRVLGMTTRSISSIGIAPSRTWSPMMRAPANPLPTVFGNLPAVVEANGLLGFELNRAEIGRRAAALVEKILKGAKPADLPVELPTRFDLTVNMKTAKALGLTLPQSVLVQASRVIE